MESLNQPNAIKSNLLIWYLYFYSISQKSIANGLNVTNRIWIEGQLDNEKRHVINVTYVYSVHWHKSRVTHLRRI